MSAQCSILHLMISFRATLFLFRNVYDKNTHQLGFQISTVRIMTALHLLKYFYFSINKHVFQATNQRVLESYFKSWTLNMHYPCSIKAVIRIFDMHIMIQLKKSLKYATLRIHSLPKYDRLYLLMWMCVYIFIYIKQNFDSYSSCSQMYICYCYYNIYLLGWNMAARFN